MVINGRRIAWRPKVLTNTNSIMGRATTASTPSPAHARRKDNLFLATRKSRSGSTKTGRKRYAVP